MNRRAVTRVTRMSSSDSYSPSSQNEALFDDPPNAPESEMESAAYTLDDADSTAESYGQHTSFQGYDQTPSHDVYSCNPLQSNSLSDGTMPLYPPQSQYPPQNQMNNSPVSSGNYEIGVPVHQNAPWPQEVSAISALSQWSAQMGPTNSRVAVSATTYSSAYASPGYLAPSAYAPPGYLAPSAYAPPGYLAPPATIWDGAERAPFNTAPAPHSPLDVGYLQSYAFPESTAMHSSSQTGHENLYLDPGGSRSNGIVRVYDRPNMQLNAYSETSVQPHAPHVQPTIDDNLCAITPQGNLTAMAQEGGQPTCGNCGQVFRGTATDIRHNLTRHQRFSCPEGPDATVFPCRGMGCTKSYRRDDNRREHERKFHYLEGLPPLSRTRTRRVIVDANGFP